MVRWGSSVPPATHSFTTTGTGRVLGTSGLPSPLPSGAVPPPSPWESCPLGSWGCWARVSVGSLKEQTHELRDVRAGPGGSLAIGSQSHVCPGLRRLWARGQRHPPHQTQTGNQSQVVQESRDLTAECLAGTNPWCYGNLSLASIVVLATWGMPGDWEWGEPFLRDLLGLAWRCGGRMLGPGDLG